MCLLSDVLLRPSVCQCACDFCMADKERHVCIKSCVKLGKNFLNVDSFWRAEKWKNTSFEGFSQFQSCVTKMWQACLLILGIHGVVHYELVPEDNCKPPLLHGHLSCVCGKVSCESDLKNENWRVGFCIIMMHLLTLHWLCINFWLKTK